MWFLAFIILIIAVAIVKPWVGFRSEGFWFGVYKSVLLGLLFYILMLGLNSVELLLFKDAYNGEVSYCSKFIGSDGQSICTEESSRPIIDELKSRNSEIGISAIMLVVFTIIGGYYETKNKPQKIRERE